MTKVIPRREGIGELLALPTVKALVTTAAGEIAQGAADSVPVRTGALKRSYKHTRAVSTGDAVTATAYTTDPAGHIVEWGSARQAPMAPLRRAAESTGLRTRLNPKGA